MLSGLWQHLSLIHTLTRREILSRYRGSLMGVLWSFLNPVLMLCTYTFVFSVVFKARWNSGSESRTEFALILFAGLMVYNLFAECISKAPSLILNNTNYVKKVIFPLEILPWVQLGAALFHLAISLGVWLLAHLLLAGTPPITVLWMPVILTPFVLFIMGLSWLLAALAVYWRDIGQFVGIVLSVLMFLSPIFYPASVLPEAWRPLLMLNPITPTVEMTRAALHAGQHPDLTLLALSTMLGISAATAGFAWFQKSRKGFADVL